jgi:acetolactate synthase-1/2/3 large subunit
MVKLNQIRKGSEILNEMFKKHGVTHVFYMEAVLRQTMLEMERTGIKRILCHSEKGAAYMADGYARATRRPGVCLAQSVGAANLAAGLQDAYLSHSPVLAITGCKPSAEKHRNTYQELDHWPLYQPVTKYNVSIQTTDELPQALRQAFREAMTGAPGPVHLEFPQHQGLHIELGATSNGIAVDKRFAKLPPFRPYPDPADLAEVVKQIYDAKRPILVIGLGAVLSGAGPELATIVDTLGIPFATTVDGKGLIPDTHPLCVGPIGGYGRKCANTILSEADLVVFIGSGLDDQVTSKWSLPSQDTHVIQIDIDPSELGRNYFNCASIMADAKAAALSMMPLLSETHKNASWAQKATETVVAWRHAQSKIRALDSSPICVERLCHEVQQALPENAALVADTGFSAIWAGSFIELTQQGQRFFRPGGGSLGWGFPASLGVKCGMPERPVVCFTGDGAFWYHLNELETAVRHKINTVTILNNNGGLGQCYRGIKSLYNGIDGRPEDLYEYSNINFAELCEKMGAFAVRVKNAKDIAPAIREALSANKPAVVEVITDITADPQGY